MLSQGKRYAVFSLKKMENGGGVLWTRAGNAWVNKDGSMNVYLDVLPIDGRLHVREGGERKEAGAADPRARAPEAPVEAAPLAMGAAL